MIYTCTEAQLEIIIKASNINERDKIRMLSKLQNNDCYGFHWYTIHCRFSTGIQQSGGHTCRMAGMDGGGGKPDIPHLLSILL